MERAKFGRSGNKKVYRKEQQLADEQRKNQKKANNIAMFGFMSLAAYTQSLKNINNANNDNI